MWTKTIPSSSPSSGLSLWSVDEDKDEDEVEDGAENEKGGRHIPDSTGQRVRISN